MKEALPGCSLKIFREFLKKCKLNIDEQFSDSEIEIWTDEEKVTMVRLPISEDPIYFGNVYAIVEAQLNMTLSDIPYYRSLISDRYDPEGRGDC